MQATTLLYAGAATVYIVLGVRYWIVDRRDEARRLFMGFSLCFALWAFGYAMHTASSGEFARDFWRRIGYTGALTYEIFVFMFFLRHTGIVESFRKRWPLAAALWVVQLPLLYVNLVQNGIHESFPNGFWYLALHVVASFFNLASIAVIAVWIRRTPLVREKRQGWIIAVGAAVTIAITIPCDFIMGGAGLPTLTPVLILLWIATIYFAEKRYRFMGVTPQSIGPEVLEQIGDFVAVTDSSDRLILANRRLTERTGCGAGSGFSALFTRPGDVRERVVRLESGEAEWEPVRFSLNGPEARIPVTGRLSRIRDRFGDGLGTLFVGRELVQIERLGALYRLTGRELNIVDELASGNPNREIAENLGISENTVKAHITNVYNKLCIANRVELINLLEGLGVVSESFAECN